MHLNSWLFGWLVGSVHRIPLKSHWDRTIAGVTKYIFMCLLFYPSCNVVGTQSMCQLREWCYRFYFSKIYLVIDLLTLNLCQSFAHKVEEKNGRQLTLSVPRTKTSVWSQTIRRNPYTSPRHPSCICHVSAASNIMKATRRLIRFRKVLSERTKWTRSHGSKRAGWKS